VDEMGGIMQKAPYVSAIFVLAGMAALGLPGTMGFVGELTIIVSAIKAFGPWIAIIAVGSLIAAGYVIWAVRRALHAEISPTVAKSNFDMGGFEFMALVIFAFFIILFGVYPQPIFDIANNAFTMFGGM
jgi:NADH-quinone oxidoreductase subunit M